MGNKLIDAAVQRGYISKAQADLLNEELFMFPGGNVLAMMLRRAMISAEQAKVLEDPESALEVEETDFDFGPTVPSNTTGSALQKGTLPLKSPELPSSPISKRTDPASSGSMRVAPRLSLSEALQHSFQAANVALPGASSSASEYPKVSVSNGDKQSNGIFPDPGMIRILLAGRERGCSDLHLTVGKPPYFRKDGKIFFLDESPLTAEVSRKLNRSVLTQKQQVELDQDLQLDFSFEWGAAGRFRANVYQQRLGLEGAYRFIPGEISTLSDLGLPRILEKLTTYPQGMNLVTGPGGSGKTTTVIAMLEHINRHRHEHIITVEDPVEYVLHGDACQVTQREVGLHTDSFAHALRTALRQDPDVIMIGELRDLETTSISITAAETGHLVFGTLHTSSAIRTVARILDVYPPAQRAQICMMVAESLRGIMSQQLVERKDGRGRACAMEVLLVTTGVAQVIKEGKTHQLVSHMQSGRKLGMISMDDALMELFQSGAISGREAYNRAENKAPFDSTKGQA